VECPSFYSVGWLVCDTDDTVKIASGLDNTGSYPWDTSIMAEGQYVIYITAEDGKGGMGAVYKARQKSMNRLIALKMLPSSLAQDRVSLARFKREAKAVARLNHPNIVHVYSVEESAGVHFITMELVRGKTLFPYL